MTQPLLHDFEDRKRQVRHYLAVVMKAERTARIGTATSAENGRLLILRAGTFLVLYNLIEATTRGAIEAIHDKITTQAVPFGSLTITLRGEVVNRFKRGSGANSAKLHTMADFPSAFVAVTLAQGIDLSGNVDAKAIRELGSCYGFSCITENSRTRDGSDLVTIKQNRNDLAHGRKTFEEVGRDHTSTELILLSRRAMRYMGEIAMNVSLYLDNEDYLDKPVAQQSMVQVSDKKPTKPWWNCFIWGRPR